jgi:iron complex outermembrane receptor protein
MLSVTANAASCLKLRALALAGSASALALIGASAAFAQVSTTPSQPPAAPPDASQAIPAPADQAAAQQVTVTGTRIRGVAPVGSEIVSVSQQDVKRSGLSSTADLLYNVPSILTLGAGNNYEGGPTQGNDGLNSLAFGKSPDIRGFGPQATLSLVEGHRMAYEGANMDEFDGDNYPVQMIERIDVVEDGTSPLYGADAIAGTVNYILRSPFNGEEAYAGYSHAAGQDSRFATGIFGRKWDSGGFIFSYQHVDQDALKASARPNLYNDNYTPYGGPPSGDFSTPGNVIGANHVEYAIPAGQKGAPLLLTQLGAPGSVNHQNSWTGIDAIPGETADHVALNFNQDLTPWLQVFGDGLYTNRTFSIHLPAHTYTNITAAVPSTNPFSPCNPLNITPAMAALATAICGSAAGGPLTVHYSSVDDSGPPVRHGNAATWEIHGGLRISLPYDWKATLAATDADHIENAYTDYNLAPAVASYAGTFNFFCDSRVNACNSGAADTNLLGAFPALTRTDYQMQDYSVNADGRVFALPGGDVRLAVGAEYYTAKFININNVGSTVAGVNQPPIVDPRNVSSVYGELYVPIVGPQNGVPGVEKLELDIAGRLDSYSDTGTTTNPKIGLNWTPFEGLKLHASYGTSFKAPGLANDDPTSQHVYLESPTIPAGSFPGLCAACSGTVYQVVGGAAHDLTPEHSTSYSLGGDWTPKQIPGLAVSLNYWWVNYTNQIGTWAYNSGAIGAINQQLFNNYIVYNPALFPALAANNPVGYFGKFPVHGSYTVGGTTYSCQALESQKITTAALFSALSGCINTGSDGAIAGPPIGQGGVPGSTLLAIEDGHSFNGGSTEADGLDISGSYTFRNDAGEWRVGGAAEYINDWKVAVIAGAPLVQDVNHFLYPQRFKGRAEFDWNRDFTDFGNLSLSAFVNYQNPYTIDKAFLPAGVNPATYSHISSNTTVDLTLGYDTKTLVSSELAQNLTVTLSIQNLFDTKPPLVLDTAASAGVQFDPAEASSLGRVIQIQVGKKF